ncbi:MAG: LptF/LptG family permease [Acidobacteriota bacterium]
MLLDRYLIRELGTPFLLGILVYTSILLVRTFFSLADSWVKGTLDLPDLIQSLALILPSILAQTIPMSVLMGVVIGFSRLSADSEITALRASGVSYYRLLLPTGLVALLALAATAVVYLHLVPKGNRAYLEVRRKAEARSDLNREVRPGTWIRLDEVSLYARHVDQTAEEPWLEDVDILLARRDSSRLEHLKAERARIRRVAIDDTKFRLELVTENARSVTWPKDGEGDPVRFEGSVLERQGPEQHRKLELASRVGSPRDLRSKSLGELREYLAALDRMDAIEKLPEDQILAARRELQVEYGWTLTPERDKRRSLALLEVHKKWSFPFACLVFSLLGMPLGIATRRGGRPASFVVSVGVIILWWILFSVGDALRNIGQLSAAATAWLPNVAIGAVGIYLVVRQRQRRRWPGPVLLANLCLLVAWTLACFLGGHYVSRGSVGVTATAPLPWLWPAVIGTGVLWVLLASFPRQVAKVLDGILSPLQRRAAAPAARKAADPKKTEARIEAEATRLANRDQPTLTGMVLDPARRSPRLLLDRLRWPVLIGFLACAGLAVAKLFERREQLTGITRELIMSPEGLGLVGFAFAGVLLRQAGVRIIRTADAWVLAGYAKTLTTMLASLVVLYVVIQFVEIASDVLENDIPFRRVLDFYLNLIPRIFLEMTPLAAMVSALVQFGVAAKFNETTAFRCCGTSLFRLVLPVLMVAALISGAIFLVHDHVLPAANARAEALKDEIRGRPRGVKTQGESQVIARDGRSLYLFRHFRVLPPAKGQTEGRPHLLSPTVLRYDDQNRIRTLISATDAHWNGRTWVLRAGWEARFPSPTEMTKRRFETLPLALMEEPEYFATDPVDPEEMNLREFATYMEAQRAAGYPVNGLETELQSKLAFPLATVVLVLVGLPFAFTTGRRGALYGVGIAIILAVLYFVAMAFFKSLGAAGYLAPLVAAWAPNVLFTLVGLFLMLNVRT